MNTEITWLFFCLYITVAFYSLHMLLKNLFQTTKIFSLMEGTRNTSQEATITIAGLPFMMFN